MFRCMTVSNGAARTEVERWPAALTRRPRAIWMRASSLSATWSSGLRDSAVRACCSASRIVALDGGDPGGKSAATMARWAAGLDGARPQRVLRGHPPVVGVAQVGRRVGDLDVGARVVRRELGRADGGVVGADLVAGAAQGHRQDFLTTTESGSAAAAARQ